MVPAAEKPSEGRKVLLVEPEAKREEWPLGRITETHPGAGGQVRVAKVAVDKYEYLKPGVLTIYRIYLLGNFMHKH